MPGNGRPDPGPLPLGDNEGVRIELARVQEQLAAAEQARTERVQQLETLQGKFDQLQSTRASEQEELGKLRHVAESVEQLTAERDALRKELEETRSSIPDEVQEHVQASLDSLNKAHAEELAALQADRDRLQGRVTELEGQAAASGGQAMSTGDLAGHFAGVLTDLGNRPPAPGEAFSAALTSLNVQAKGLLRTNEQGEIEIMPVEAAAASAEQLSTVQMELRLLPRLPPAAQPAPPDGPQ